MPSIFGKFFGNTVSGAAGFAAGAATSRTLEPGLQDLTNEAWSTHASRPLDAGTVAGIVAEDVEAQPWGEDESAKTGIDADRFAALLGEALNAPGLGELYAAWRRDLIDDATFEHGLRKAKLEPRWDAPLKALKGARLAPAQIALGIVRSLLADPGFMPVTLDTSGGKVPAYGVSKIDPETEAEATGIDPERLRIMVGEIGLPMPPDAAAGAVFRNIIERADFNRSVLEGDTRPEWADAIFEHARQIPSVADYVNAHIRGWIDADAMHAGAARHGMSAADVDLLYLRTGRPAAPGQMATAAARGIDGPDGKPMDKAQFVKGIAESDIRPEWANMLWESRFLYPPLFQITRLVQANAITAETARDWAVKDRYPPEVVAPLYEYWSQPTASTADPWTKRAQSQLWSATHRSFLAGDATEQDVIDNLAVLGLSDAAQSAVVGLWTNEQRLIRARLTPAQVKKAYAKAVTNPATNEPWSLDDALAELLSRGWSKADAQTFLAE